MDAVIVSTLIFAFLLASAYMGISLVYPLLLGLAGFVLLSRRKGFAWPGIWRMIIQGGRKSLVVIRIFVLIGVITAVWRACGTVAFIVYHGLALMNAQYFVLSAFVLSAIVSFLLGTSFGTVGTVGVILMVLAKSGQVDVNVAAGAIIAGAYFGDRCSPMSSSAALVAALTQTELYTNIKNMLRTTVVPVILSLLCYGFLSRLHPLVFQDTRLADEIQQVFAIPAVTILPAALILAAAAFKIEVKVSMLLSIICGLCISLWVQHQTPVELLGYILTGYSTGQPGFFAGIIQGGGLLSMVNVGLIVLISSAYSGIFEGTGLLIEVEACIIRMSRRVGTFLTTLLTGTASSAFACNQTLAVILAYQFTHKLYRQDQLGQYQLALDLENTVIVLAAIIPWNIAGAFPAAALSADAGFIAYAYYLFLVPAVNLVSRYAKSDRPDPNENATHA